MRGQGQRDHPPPRPGDPAAHRQGVLLVRRRHAAPGGAQARLQDRRDRARRAQPPASSSRATPTRNPSRTRASSPTGTCPARAPRRSSTTSRRSASCPPACPSRATAARSPSTAIPRRKAVRRTAGWRSSSPASTPAPPTRSQPPSAWRRSSHGQEDRPSNRSARRARRRVQVRARQAGQGGAQAPRRGHGLHAPEGVPGQPRRRPLRQDADRPRPRPRRHLHGRRRRPRGGRDPARGLRRRWPRRASSAT